ncbi:MAG TPA: hypothetical protein VIH76_08095 [Candidatus Acidoferrales bacterium]
MNVGVPAPDVINGFGHCVAVLLASLAGFVVDTQNQAARTNCQGSILSCFFLGPPRVLFPTPIVFCPELSSILFVPQAAIVTVRGDPGNRIFSRQIEKVGALSSPRFTHSLGPT